MVKSWCRMFINSNHWPNWMNAQGSIAAMKIMEWLIFRISLQLLCTKQVP